jgi:hypothetical protein
MKTGGYESIDVKRSGRKLCDLCRNELCRTRRARCRAASQIVGCANSAEIRMNRLFETVAAARDSSRESINAGLDSEGSSIDPMRSPPSSSRIKSFSSCTFNSGHIRQTSVTICLELVVSGVVLDRAGALRSIRSRNQSSYDMTFRTWQSGEHMLQTEPNLVATEPFGARHRLMMSDLATTARPCGLP